MPQEATPEYIAFLNEVNARWEKACKVTERLEREDSPEGEAYRARRQQARRNTNMLLREIQRGQSLAGYKMRNLRYIG